MKRINLLLILTILLVFQLNAQIEDPECVSCKGNIVDFAKIASAIGEKNTSTGKYPLLSVASSLRTFYCP